MIALISRFRPIWPLLTALGSGAMLAGAHAFERFGGLEPCPLCLDQRKWHWAVVGVSLLALGALRLRPGLARWAAALIGCVLLGAALMGAYHVAVEQHWVIAQCDARIDMSQIRPFDLDGELTVPKCDQIAWSMFGISMAGYNALISLALALTSFCVALTPERKS
ncbi:MAG: disulfide bond formation protein B [Hyphomonadaceae bacterium]|nr:disulfide bond formation protein B [Hyphomonadaceae bacterium]